MPGFVHTAQPATPADSNYYRPGEVITITMAKGGVITGTVSGPTGPIVATVVRAMRLRDAEGKPVPFTTFGRDRMTDDRGMFRLYGLPAGVYLVAAGGSLRGGRIVPTSYDADTFTYFPSSTRDTASEIVVRSGEETTANIQYRSDSGRAVSGTVVGIPDPAEQYFSTVTVSLTDVRDRATILNAFGTPYTNYAWALYGVPDGNYELSATFTLRSRETLKAEPRRIRVLGADVDSIKLVLTPQAGIDGRVVLESNPNAECGKRRDTAIRETLIFARRYEPATKSPTDAKGSTPEVSILVRNQVAESVPDATGSFTMRNLAAGTYRIEAVAPASGWYVRTISLGPAQTVAAKTASLALARDGLTLKSAERLSGLTITIAEGAAGIRGRVTVPEGEQLPVNLHVYIVPAEKNDANDILRFFEVQPESDGTFAVGHISPGKYWISAQQNQERDQTEARSIRQDGVLRSAVLREAERTHQEVLLKPCERVTDYQLAYSSSERPK
ncbi:MAG TPA: carboxypeptidase-like regulatory domain-containing protein [Pyrinomonadaceae bacterium]|nr:carboxypeptidase-like regulatory domain-containing protein [Pyrinomonadaceae bacterium]